MYRNASDRVRAGRRGWRGRGWRNGRCHRRSHDASRLGSATAAGLWIQSLDTEALDLFKRLSISSCLAATRGNQIRAAQLLGVNRDTLRKKIRDLGLEVIKGLKTD
jgi:two-component system nitrogen regulation response regulator GlnG